MAKMLMRVEGINGQIELLNDRVVIRREGLMNVMKYGLNAKREIPLAAISEIMFRDASRLRMGEVEFIRGGRSTHERDTKKKADGIVRFRYKDQQAFEAMKEKVFELMNQMQRRN